MTQTTTTTYRPLDISPRQADYLAALVEQVLFAEAASPEQEADVLAALTTSGARSTALKAALHVRAAALTADLAADPDEADEAVRQANAAPLSRAEVSDVIDALRLAAGILSRPADYAEVLTWAESSTDGFVASLVRQYRGKGTLSARQWAVLAENRAAATSPAQAFTAPADGTVRFKQYEREWVVIGTAEQVRTGHAVDVTLKSGRTKSVYVGETVLVGEGFVLARTTTKQVARELAHDLAVIPADEVTVPLGFYAVPTEGAEANDLLFVRVAERPTGEVRLYQIVGGKTDLPLTADRGRAVLARIVAAGADTAGKTYADEIGRCWRCGRTLTDEESRAAGIGPDCRSRL